MFRLDNPIRSYAWGSQTVMAEYFGRTPSGSPEAEMWMGAHPDSPSTARAADGTAARLDHLIQTSPETFLGPVNAEAFGDRLPFLAKVLAADSPLSLQVHPTVEQAQRGYAAEHEAGAARAVSGRNYKDANHKPEMIVALSSFDALCGFRSPAEAKELFCELADLFRSQGLAVPETIEATAAHLGSGENGLRQAVSYLIAGREEVADAVEASAALLARLSGVKTEFATLVSLENTYPRDPGVLISLLLNHVTLQPGEALCLPAGNVHAYLKGLGFEVMASSDNVLRGGLTSKHVDIPEFMKTVDFRPLPVPTMKAKEPAHGIKRWIPPFKEFQVEQIATGAGDPAVTLNQNGPVLVLVTQGQGALSTPAGKIELGAGESAFVPADEHPVQLGSGQGTSETLVAFAVTVGTPAP